MIVPVVVEGQSIRWYEDPPDIADNSIEFVQLEFRLPEDWRGLSVTAQFTQTKTYNHLLIDGRCYLPPELTAGHCEVSIFGYSDGEVTRGTTIPLQFNIRRSGFVSSAETPIPPTPDLYAQLLQYLAKPVVPQVGENGHWFVNGVDTGVTASGYTPQKGIDYWTPGDKQEIVDDVLVELPETGGPGGASGAGLWTLIREETLAEDVREYFVNKNAKGDPFAYDELMITTYQKSALASSGKLYYHFNGVQCGSPYAGKGGEGRATMFRASRDGMISCSYASGPEIKESSGGIDNIPSSSSTGMYFPAVASASKLASAKLSTDWWSTSLLRAGLIVRVWGRNK